MLAQGRLSQPLNLSIRAEQVMAGNCLPAVPGAVPAAAGPVAGAECTVCGWRWGREVLPFPRCYLCGDAPAFHHGRCCRLRPVGLVAAAVPVASAAAGPLAPSAAGPEGPTARLTSGWNERLGEWGFRRLRSRSPCRAASEYRRQGGRLAKQFLTRTVGEGPGPAPSSSSWGTGGAAGEGAAAGPAEPSGRVPRGAAAAAPLPFAEAGPAKYQCLTRTVGAGAGSAPPSSSWGTGGAAGEGAAAGPAEPSGRYDLDPPTTEAERAVIRGVLRRAMGGAAVGDDSRSPSRRRRRRNRHWWDQWRRWLAGGGGGVVRARSPSSAAGEEYAEEAEEEENEEEAEEAEEAEAEENEEEDEEEEEEEAGPPSEISRLRRHGPPHPNDGEERPWLLPPSRWWQQWNVSVAGPDHSRELDAANGGPRQRPRTPSPEWCWATPQDGPPSARYSSSSRDGPPSARYRSRSRRR